MRIRPPVALAVVVRCLPMSETGDWLSTIQEDNLSCAGFHLPVGRVRSHETVARRLRAQELLRRRNSYRGPTRSTCLDKREQKETDGHREERKRTTKSVELPFTPLDDAGACTKLEGGQAGGPSLKRRLQPLS